MLSKGEWNSRFVWIVIIVIVLGLWTTCVAQKAFAQEYPIVGECPDPVEQVGAPTSRSASDPCTRFQSGWLEVEYQFDSRDGDSDRILSLEGVSKATKYLDLYGSLDLYSGLGDDLARFHLRAGVFGEITTKAGLAFWYEDFSGSWNEHAFVGAYLDVLPECRLVALPAGTEGAGAMARAMFDVPIHERWSLTGWLEASWFGEDDTYVAAEPELRYAIQKGLWATVEYRHDGRWGTEDESVAVGLRASL